MQSRGNYPKLLSQLLGASAVVSNFGHSGSTASNTSTAYAWTQEYRRSCRSQPNVVVLMLGTNDCKHSVWAKHGAAFGTQLERIGRTFLALPSRPRLLLVKPPPVRVDWQNPAVAVDHMERNKVRTCIHAYTHPSIQWSGMR